MAKVYAVKFLTGLLSAAFLAGCFFMERWVLTVEELINDKDLYHGKAIAVKGFVLHGMENCIILPNDPAMDRVDVNYLIWYREDDDEGCGSPVSSGEDKYGPATVHGIFDKEDKGHLGSFSASINGAVISWSSP